MLPLSAAAESSLQEDLQKLAEDNAESYIAPVVNILGTGMNTGWVNSSKSYEFMKLPFGLSVVFGFPVINIPEADWTYDFYGEVDAAGIVNSMGLSGPAATIITDSLSGEKFKLEIPESPTIFGSSEGQALTLKQLLESNNVDAATMTALNGTGSLDDTLFSHPGGSNLGKDVGALPFMYPQINIGLPFKLQLKLRTMPEIDLEDLGKFSFFGFGLQYEYTDHIPFLGSVPMVHASANYSHTSMELGPLSFSNWQLMPICASADFKFIVGAGVYTAIGFESSNMTFDYTVEGGIADGTNVKLDIDGDNGFRYLIGARVSVAVFDIFAEYNIGHNNAFNAGVGLGLNGL